MTRTNPRKIPRTEADCRKSYARGIGDGVRLTRAIVLSVLLDKYGAEDQIRDMWRDIVKLSEEAKEGRVDLFDLERVLAEEYGIDCKIV